MEDVRAGIIRAVGDPEARLGEDHLRALRAVRLASRLRFEIEPATAAAISRHARELVGVSRERIGEEIRRMMSHPSRAEAAGRIEALGLDGPVLGVARGGGGNLSNLGSLAEDAPVATCLCAWALDRGAPLEAEGLGGLVNSWRASLCLSNEVRDDMMAALAVLVLLREWGALGVARRKRIAASRGFDQALVLLGAIDGGVAVEIARNVGELGASAGGLAPAPLVTGEDLIGIGLSPGPDFGRILDSVYDAQLEGRVADRSSAMELARSLNV
jgi:poly(A) polymerase